MYRSLILFSALSLTTLSAHALDANGNGLNDVWEIIFNAGSHVETVHMAYSEFARIVQPRVASFATSAGS